MSRNEKSPFTTPSQSSWKSEEGFTDEENEAHLRDKIESYVLRAAKFDSFMTAEEQAENLKFKARTYGLTVEQLSALIQVERAKRKPSLEEGQTKDPEGE